jgi:hypothetical protein
VHTFEDSFPWAYRLEGRLLPQPTVLQLCRESRSEVIGSFTKFWKYPDILKSYPELHEWQREKFIYVSLCHDTFFFRDNIHFAFEEVISGFIPEIYKVESLAVDIDFSFHGFQPNLYQILRTKFPKLKELLFVAPRQRHDWNLLTCGAIIFEDLDAKYSGEGSEHNRTFEKIFEEIFEKYSRLGEADNSMVEKLEPVCPGVSLAQMKSDHRHLELDMLYPVFSKIFKNGFTWPEEIPDYLVRRIQARTKLGLGIIKRKCYNSAAAD